MKKHKLIEMAGGYECAKAEFGALKKHPEFYEGEFAKNDALLLDYRRDHNIFEVGDLVVFKRADSFRDIFKYDSYSEKHDLHFFESKNDYGHTTLDKVRHATQSEIAAGHRIDQPNTDDVADIGYHASPLTVVTELHVSEALRLNELG